MFRQVACYALHSQLVGTAICCWHSCSSCTTASAVGRCAGSADRQVCINSTTAGGHWVGEGRLQPPRRTTGSWLMSSHSSTPREYLQWMRTVIGEQRNGRHSAPPSPSETERPQAGGGRSCKHQQSYYTSNIGSRGTKPTAAVCSTHMSAAKVHRSPSSCSGAAAQGGCCTQGSR